MRVRHRHDEQLVATYGEGVFDEAIRLLVPDSAYDDCDLHAQTVEPRGADHCGSTTTCECLAFLLAALTGTAETQYSSYLRDVLNPAEQCFVTADQALGASGR
ncbi:hypothetical protein ACFY3O_14240 [Streptomyces sp. NPDC001046]|uniref:hypothetical protein n=1 Tax=unclassified Streptomyces TaxID=2593676 RepID=UPI00367B785A